LLTFNEQYRWINARHYWGHNTIMELIHHMGGEFETVTPHRPNILPNIH
jgi:hypothetical protein